MADDVSGSFSFTNEMVASFSDVDYAIYSTIMHTGSLLAFMQVRDVAKDAHVSAASVVRFCKKCGCAGYAEFRERYCAGLHSGGVKMQVDELEVLESFIRLARTPEFDASMQKAFNLLRWARLTLFLGIGVSNHLAAAGARMFLNSGCFALAIDDPFAPLVNVPTTDTVAIALSFSGKTPQVVAMASDLLRNDAKLIAITDAKESPLAKMADASICYNVPDIPISGSLSLGTQTPVLYILERLARMLYEDTGGRTQDTYR